MIPEERTLTEKQVENINPAEKRSALFGHLDYALVLSREKASKEKAKNTERMSWTRILIQAVASYGDLLDSVQMEQFEQRLTLLEESLR